MLDHIIESRNYGYLPQGNRKRDALSLHRREAIFFFASCFKSTSHLRRRSINAEFEIEHTQADSTQSEKHLVAIVTSVYFIFFPFINICKCSMAKYKNKKKQ